MGDKTSHASPKPKSLRIESCRREKVKTVTQIDRHMTLDNFGAPILSIDIAGFIIRKIFMQPS
jgi:hypothetical protein